MFVEDYLVKDQRWTSLTQMLWLNVLYAQVAVDANPTKHNTYALNWTIRIVRVGDADAHVDTHGDQISAEDFEFFIRFVTSQATKLLKIMSTQQTRSTSGWTCKGSDRRRDTYNTSIKEMIDLMTGGIVSCELVCCVGC